MINKKNKFISIVLPVFNEEVILKELHQKLSEAISKRSEQFEIIFVNDGSVDKSLAVLLGIRKQDNRICILDFARNFGHQVALNAGLREAKGDAVILMDSDMEDYPEDILKLLEQWDLGYEVVYAIRKKRQVSWLKSLFFKLFHKFNNKVSTIDMGVAGIFSLMDRVVVNEIMSINEHNPYLPGLRSWVGFKQIGLEIDRGLRYDASPRINIPQLYKLAFDSFTGFSGNLLSLPIIIGLIFFTISIFSLIVIVTLKIIYGIGPWGWASLASIILLISGVQFAFIGLLGEYIFRIMEEVKGRPLYIIREKYMRED
jgi:glycosyltransferase involved in cell wall biosynthesis